MGEIKTLYPEGQLSVTEQRDIAKNTIPPEETNVLEVKTANEWIEEVKNKPIPLPLLDCLWYHCLRLVYVALGISMHFTFKPMLCLLNIFIFQFTTCCPLPYDTLL